MIMITRWRRTILVVKPRQTEYIHNCLCHIQTSVNRCRHQYRYCVYIMGVSIKDRRGRMEARVKCAAQHTVSWPVQDHKHGQYQSIKTADGVGGAAQTNFPPLPTTVTHVKMQPLVYLCVRACVLDREQHHSITVRRQRFKTPVSYSWRVGTTLPHLQHHHPSVKVHRVTVEGWKGGNYQGVSLASKWNHPVASCYRVITGPHQHVSHWVSL